MKVNFFVFIFLVLSPFFVYAQIQGPKMDAFYGAQSFQEVSVVFSPMILPCEHSAMYGVDFGFETLSRNTMFAKRWKYYYGVGLFFADASGGRYDFSDDFGERDFSLYYGRLDFLIHLFYSDEEKFRPFIGAKFGSGIGEIKLSEPEEPWEKELDWKRLDLFEAGLELGSDLMLNDKYAVHFVVEGSYLWGMFEGDNIGISPLKVSIGISRWIVGSQEE